MMNGKLMNMAVYCLDFFDTDTLIMILILTDTDTFRTKSQHIL